MRRWLPLALIFAPCLAFAEGADSIQVAPGLGDLAKMLVSLGLILFLIYISATLLRQVRFGSSALGNDDSLRVVKTLSVSPKEKILIIQAGKEQVLVGSSSAGLQKLHELKEPIPVMDASVQKRSFNTVLRSLSGRFHNAS
ncbi:MAG: flagellar biosynthetic protein FliO [Pseudomonadota bacterium]